jgi:ribose/xylose/arabinose/galactoside ABC-type transport system permease subunit
VTWRRFIPAVPGTQYAALATLVVLVLVNAVLTPNFATAGNLWNVLLQVAPVALSALGMTFVIATRGIDLSTGSTMAVAAAVMAVLAGYGAGVAFAGALAVALLLGTLNGGLVASLGVQPIVVTLATLIGGRGLAQIISNDGELITIDNPVMLALGRGHIGPVPIPVVVALVAFASALFVLRATRFGRSVLATGGNPAAARLAGVPVGMTLVSVYVISASLSAVAGMIVAARLGASDAAKIGQNMELDAIAAVVVGGTALSGGRATIGGTVVGALMMQVIATSFNMLLVSNSWSLALKAALILLAVYLQRPKRV